MKRIFCDRCGREHSPETKVMNYWLRAEIDVEGAGNENHDFNYGIESRGLELCQPCVEALAKLCKEFCEDADQPSHKTQREKRAPSQDSKEK
jgi:hypothetical protein